MLIYSDSRIWLHFVSLGASIYWYTAVKLHVYQPSGFLICRIYKTTLHWPNQQCCLAGSSKTATRILIFSIVMGANYSFYVKSNTAYVLTFLGYNNSVLAKNIADCYIFGLSFGEQLSMLTKE
jgi:hypothetical protein